MTNKKKEEHKDNKELEKLAAKAEEYLNGWKRAKADYLNFKKQSEGRQAETIQYANAALIAELLPIYNNFKLALEHTPDELKANDWLKGVEHIQKQFTEFFKQLGIEEIKTVGEKFNPEMHEAVEMAEEEGFKPDIIFEQVSAGYTLHGKVVNPAKVKVAK